MNSKPCQRFRIFVPCLMLCLGMPACFARSSDHAYTSPAELSVADGQTIFQHICQGCHMPDAKGAVGAGTYPALAGDPHLVSAPYMAAVVLHGRRDMPSFMRTGETGPLENTKLSDTQIADVVNYVRSHFGNHYTDRISARDVAGMHP